MKICDYCGRENEDEAVRCRECGTQEFKNPTAKTEPITLRETPSESGTSPGSDAVPERPAPAWEFRELTPEEKEMDLVTLMRCRTLFEADMIASELNSAGISAFIPDEFLSQAVSWNLNTYGYVRVQVSPKDYEAAKAFLLASPGDGGISPSGGSAKPSGNSGGAEGPPAE